MQTSYDEVIRVGLYPTSVLKEENLDMNIHSREGHVKTQTQSKDGRMKMEASTGVTLPPAEKCLGSPEAGRGK